MVVHCSLSVSKSSQVSRTLLRILTVLKNAVVWMVSTCPPTSMSSGPFYIPSASVPEAPITIGIIVTFMSLSFFNSLARPRYLFFISHSFRLIYVDFCKFFTGSLAKWVECLPMVWVIPKTFKMVLDTALLNTHSLSLLFLLSLVLVVSGRDYVIRLYLKIRKNFVHLIFYNGFWVEYIPIFCIVKLKILI